ncbi:MAG: hypothetical protein AB1744_11595, partial [Candidatus Zixiibacteriota bacterium]
MAEAATNASKTLSPQSGVPVTVTVRTPGVNELYLSTIPLGMAYVNPNQSVSAILAFRIDNSFAVNKSIESVRLRHASRGNGTPAELLTNVDSIALYLDLDNDSALTISDSLVATTAFNADLAILTFSPVVIAPGAAQTFIVSIRTSLYPRDGDSLDVLLLPAGDIQTGDGTIVIGPDTANSLGYNIVDGLIADQLTIPSTGVTSMSPGDTVYHVLTVDIPRNGYQADALQIFSVGNDGTADDSDIDSITLYVDNGNGLWGGPAEETCTGGLEFTGDRWTISGLSIPLISQTTRFYVGARLSAFPTNGATLALSIPEYGLQMSSQNDGPLDTATVPADTIVIQAVEALTVNTALIPSRQVIPGQSSGPILGLEFKNSYATAVSFDSIRCTLLAVDPDGATQAELDSQVDSLLLYLDRDGDYTAIGSPDTLLTVARLTNGTA